MEFTFEATCQMHVEHQRGDSCKLLRSNLSLEVSGELDRSMYIGQDDLPTKSGSEALTKTLVTGLACNIHAAHQQGFKNDVVHLKEIIEELTKLFAAVTTVESKDFTSLKDQI